MSKREARWNLYILVGPIALALLAGIITVSVNKYVTRMERKAALERTEGKVISKEDAVRKAAAYWKRPEPRPPGGGYFVEERGSYYFVAPPYKAMPDIERAGIYIHKVTGEITSKPAEMPGK